MENFNLGDWLLNTVFTASLLSVIGFLFRDMIFKYYENRINIKFEKEMEEFRQKIREKDNHIAVINNYLTDLEKNRSKVRNDKQLIAAEDCFKLIKVLNSTNILIQILQRINFKLVFSESRELELKGFGEQLFRDCNIEDVLKEMKEQKNNYIDLYLESDVINNLHILQGITMFAIILITALKDGTTDFLKKEDKILVEQIIKYIPSTKSSFEQYGDEHMFMWHDYFLEKTLNALRSFVHGERDNSEIIKIQNITIS